LALAARPADFEKWKDFVERVKSPEDTVRIAICGKYVDLKDSYKSIIEAFIHAGVANRVQVDLRWVDSEEMEKGQAADFLAGVNGILIPGGFGNRGIEGKISAVKHARENAVPFFGICLGLQCAIIEYARNICNMADANSAEFSTKTTHPVVDLMEEQKTVSKMGGTMRLGSYRCNLKKGTLTQMAYGVDVIHERHRHRYEVNSKYVESFENCGMVASGFNPETGLVETIELEGHPWFVGVQFHPELKSRVLHAHPLFKSFVRAAVANKADCGMAHAT
jgi:CTP synthase